MELRPLTPPEVTWLVCASILVSGFFSLFEFAFDASRKLALQKEARENGKKSHAAKLLLEALENPGLYRLTALVWANIFRIFPAVMGAYYAARYSTFSMVACAVSITIAVIVISALIPGYIAHKNPEKAAMAILPLINALALPLKLLYYPARQLYAVMFQSRRNESQQQGITEEDLRIALLEGEKSGLVESKERAMVEGVFYLGDRSLGTFLTHRSEIQWLDVNAAPAEAYSKALEHKEQRCFPVAEGTLDAIIGAAYLEDIVIDQMSVQQKGLRSIMKKALFVPETMPAIKAFDSFRRAEADFIFVMDQYGGFTGLVSLRDLMEEIVGELVSSTGDADSIVPLEDGTWLADGSVNIDDAVEQFSMPANEAGPPDYHTLAGFVLSLAGELPRPGDSFAYGGFRFKVSAMDGNRIDKIHVSRL